MPGSYWSAGGGKGRPVVRLPPGVLSKVSKEETRREDKRREEKVRSEKKEKIENQSTYGISGVDFGILGGRFRLLGAHF